MLIKTSAAKINKNKKIDTTLNKQSYRKDKFIGEYIIEDIKFSKNKKNDTNKNANIINTNACGTNSKNEKSIERTKFNSTNKRIYQVLQNSNTKTNFDKKNNKNINRGTACKFLSIKGQTPCKKNEKSEKESLEIHCASSTQQQGVNEMVSLTPQGKESVDIGVSRDRAKNSSIGHINQIINHPNIRFKSQAN